MSSTKIISENVKKSLLKQIEVESKRCYLVVLDLLMPFRYIIEEQLRDIYELFNKNQTDLNNIYNGATFADKEILFYKGKIFTKIQ